MPRRHQTFKSVLATQPLFQCFVLTTQPDVNVDALNLGFVQDPPGDKMHCGDEIKGFGAAVRMDCPQGACLSTQTFNLTCGDGKQPCSSFAPRPSQHDFYGKIVTVDAFSQHDVTACCSDLKGACANRDAAMQKVKSTMLNDSAHTYTDVAMCIALRKDVSKQGPQTSSGLKEYFFYFVAYNRHDNTVPKKVSSDKFFVQPPSEKGQSSVVASSAASGAYLQWAFVDDAADYQLPACSDAVDDVAKTQVSLNFMGDSVGTQVHLTANSKLFIEQCMYLSYLGDYHGSMPTGSMSALNLPFVSDVTQQTNQRPDVDFYECAGPDVGCRKTSSLTKYPTLLACQQNCAVGWNCSNGSCISAKGGAKAQFATLESCKKGCSASNSGGGGPNSNPNNDPNSNNGQHQADQFAAFIEKYYMFIIAFLVLTVMILQQKQNAKK